MAEEFVLIEQIEPPAPWHTLGVEDSARVLETDVDDGLCPDDASERLGRYGPNMLRVEKRRHPFLRFLSQFNDFMIYVLLAAVLISGVLLEEYVDALVILVIVIFNAVLGFVQESRAETAMEELKKLAAPTAKVIRDGVESTLASADLVPGDLLVLETGDLISADARLVTAVNLRTNEASLTGESEASAKHTGIVADADAAVGDRDNMVFAGTHVDYGRGAALVVATGHSTQMGEIAEMLESGKPQATPLQKELKDVGRRIVYICLFVSVVVFTLGMIKGNPFATMLLFAVSLAVAAIPEGLPAIVTITLARGTQAMARRNAIIRNLPAVETLGCANYICTDKTGTLTLNHMTVVEAVLPGGDTLALSEALADDALRASDAFRLANTVAALCEDARRTHTGHLVGDSTEVALLEAATRAGYEKRDLEALHPREWELPFDSDRKMMTTMNRDNGGYMVLTKGAAESVLASCSTVQGPSGPEPLTDEARSRILAGTAALGERALRTIAFAVGSADAPPPSDSPRDIERGLMFVGAYSMMDPPRPEAAEALDTCRSAHIKVAMVTGDHLATARAIGREMGLLSEDARVVEEHELERMSPEELTAHADEIGVFARVSPRHKVKIVEALQSEGYVVAMTGDGVNDAPALHRADIGVAMGITGTDVAKQASDMVLADDNFATIVSAVKQGRIIFSNLKKFIYFLLSCNISEVLTMFLAMLFGFPLPLVPAMILWINLVTDGLPALALGVEPPESDVMAMPPRRMGENILSAPAQLNLLTQGVIITAGALAAFALSNYWLGYNWDKVPQLEMCQTIVFTTMVLAQVFHSFNWRSERRSLFAEPPWKNPWLLGAFVVSIGLQMAVLYVPFMQKAFHTHAPSARAWALILACSIVPVLLIDRVSAFKAWLAARKEAAEPGE
ncbi:MAG: cation-translocating P-type ATPase [Actinobacteria bacterium]|nr:cation-translocating P-type ATPase [Actinomycetota bacterium]MBU1944165.1 cation-translocating P-type ATPase [Actinomycetota bacterium]MBU2687484.1 cation-translocating P-type ATPase [Actinomycetota bacterium]